MDWRRNASCRRTRILIVNMGRKARENGGCYLQGIDKGRTTLDVVFLSLQNKSARVWTYQQGGFLGLKCLEYIFSVDLLNVKC